jgi:uncharacterized protein (DUF4415 family)
MKTPFSAAEMAAALAAAPEVMDGDDLPYDPNDKAAEDAYWANAIVSHSYAELKEKLAQRRRGPGKAPRKSPSTIRFDPDVLAGLRALGKGWQTRVNDAMREWLKTHSPAP